MWVNSTHTYRDIQPFLYNNLTLVLKTIKIYLCKIFHHLYKLTNSKLTNIHTNARHITCYIRDYFAHTQAHTPTQAQTHSHNWIPHSSVPNHRAEHWESCDPLGQWQSNLCTQKTSTLHTMNYYYIEHCHYFSITTIITIINSITGIIRPPSMCSNGTSGPVDFNSEAGWFTYL